MKRYSKIIVLLLCMGLLLTLSTACSQIQKSLDVIGKGSVSSFGMLLEAMPENVAEDKERGAWVLTAPDQAVRFMWSKNWDSSAAGIMLELDARPFLAAGLDPDKLPDAYRYDGKTLTIGMELGEEAIPYEEAKTPLASYEQIVFLKPQQIGYHMEMDHYGLSLGNGNMLEWAKDMDVNDKDIVFALNPESFLSAGVDPQGVEGWIFAQIDTHENGKSVRVDKFIKPFDLR